ncbi:hypothetical protein BCW_A0021, partial [Bacillus cereus W]
KPLTHAAPGDGHSLSVSGCRSRQARQGASAGVGGCRGWLNYAASEQIVLRVHHMRCEIPHRCVRRKYRIRRHSPFRLRNCWEGRSVRASSLLRQNSSSVPLSLGRTRPCKTTASPVCWKAQLISAIKLQNTKKCRLKKSMSKIFPSLLKKPLKLL